MAGEAATDCCVESRGMTQTPVAVDNQTVLITPTHA